MIETLGGLQPPLPLFIAENKLTTAALIKTIAFQVGALGLGSIVGFLYVVPWLNTKQGLHPITAEDRLTIDSNPILRIWFRKAKRWFDHPILMLGGALVWGVAFILLTGTLYILLTDIGWLDAWGKYGSDPNYLMFFLMARASGAPNGAHLLSYIPLPFLGLYVAWKYRKGVFLDVYQGILIVAFGVAIHETIWLLVYFARYYVELGLLLSTNFIEDFFFFVMCIMLIHAFWKYPGRTMPLRTFKWPIVAYSVFMLWWFIEGVPVSTINNWQLGQGIYGITQYWADPFVNGIEIFSWVFIAAMFFVVIKKQ